VRRVTLADVAKLAGVSPKTVSRVINGEKYVAYETAERVRRALAQVQYVPNSPARSLSRGRAGMIGLGIGWEMSSAFAGRLVDEILECASKAGYGLMLFTNTAADVERLVGSYKGGQIDGVILGSIPGEEPVVIERLKSCGLPYVVIHPSDVSFHAHTSIVRVNDAQGVHKATQYLLHLGHRAVAFIGAKRNAVWARDRLEGYKQALAEAGVEVNPKWLYLSPDLPLRVGFQGGMEMLTRAPEVTALVCATDEIAIGALSAAWQYGKHVPEDLSVVGFDDIPVASVVTPPLTTVRQPFEVLAQTAFDLLLERLGNSAAEPQSVVLPTELVVRESCRPVVQGWPSHLGHHGAAFAEGRGGE